MALSINQSPSKDFIRLQFNRQAEKFSAWSVTKNNQYAGYYFDFCRMTPEDRLLDVSCGSGDFCIFCAQKIAHATGMDLSENMIALAEQQAGDLGKTNTTFRCADAASLPEQSGICSIVISKSAFHHYEDHDAVFREMKRCCEPGGRISVQDIVAYEKEEVNDFFESFEHLVDAGHKETCSKSFILGVYQRHDVEIISKMEVEIDLNLNDYLGHAVRSEKDSARLWGLIEEGQKDAAIKEYFFYKGEDLFFKRNVFLVLGKKKIK